MVWLDVETIPSTVCGWPAAGASNCQYITDLVAAVESHGKKAGIYASKNMWAQIAGGSCTGLTHVPMWYAHYDGNANCNDYAGLSFGGWSHATYKQYAGDKSLCGLDLDENIPC